MILEGDGLRVELPAGWNGRLLRCSPHLAALQAGSFPLDGDDDELGDRSTAAMAPGDCFLALIEYYEGSGVQPGRAPFHQQGVDLPLDPARFTAPAAPNAPAGHSMMQQNFTEGGRPFCLHLVIAGSRMDRRRPLALLDRVLASLSVVPRPAPAP